MQLGKQFQYSIRSILLWLTVRRAVVVIYERVGTRHNGRRPTRAVTVSHTVILRVLGHAVSHLQLETTTITRRCFQSEDNIVL